MTRGWSASIHRSIRAGSGVGRTSAMTLPLVVVGWWIVVGAIVSTTLPTPAASAPKIGLSLLSGQTRHIKQPGMTSWPVPTDRAAFDEYNRGVQESDDAAIEAAFETYEWVQVADGQAVRIVQVDGEAIQVELLDGQNAGRQVWLKPRHLYP